MLRFCANLSMLFTELPLEQRFAAAKRHGFQAVEIQFPYELPAERIKALLDEHGLRMVLFNVPADDLLQGGEGLAAVPEKRERFLDGLQQACDYAVTLDALLVNILPGRCLNRARLNDYLSTFIQNLRLAADRLAGIGVTAVFEAINSVDMPGFLLDDHAKMLAVFSELAHPNLGLQYDIYHMSRMQQDCTQFLARHIDKISHIQFADCPGRGQPGSGTVDFDALFDLLRKLNYCGWVGAEYKPTGNTVDSLSWLQSR
ncbi:MULTISPECIES: hydroxypyruvate isomerase family protein [Methylomonas]|uniref:hydroxypyruvate isomerase family protein n=1 Tax=Methylomonas TaxID=416 RepID=UPI001231C5C8|nr:TIM barrel protein [Methylomonas rhizoryzae]